MWAGARGAVPAAFGAEVTIGASHRLGRSSAVATRAVLRVSFTYLFGNAAESAIDHDDDNDV